MNTPPSPPPPPRVTMDPTLTYQPREVGGRTVIVVGRPEVGKFFHMGPVEHRVALLLDGNRDVNAITNQLNLEGIDWQPEDVAQLISQFVTNKVATPEVVPPQIVTPQSPGTESTSQPPSQPTPSAAQPPPPRKLSIAMIGALSMTISQRFPLFACNRLADRLARRVGFVFSNLGMAIWAVLVATGIGIVMANQQPFYAEVTRMFDPGIWIVLMLIWVVAKVMHELGHATVARHHGVHVGQAGIMFFLLAPLAYVDVTDAWKLPSRWKRVQIALAGVYVELAIAAVAAWMWYFLPDGYARHLMAQVFLVAGPATLLVNANPLLRLDGYYVVSDLTEIANLRMHGRAQLGGLINAWLVKIPADTARLSGWRRPFATLHALASVVFQVIWMSGLVIGVSLWAEGLGILLALAAAILWGVLPTIKWVMAVWNHEHDPSLEKRSILGGPHRRRLAVVVTCLIASLAYFATVPSPLARRVPVVVRFCDEQIARAASDAFVEQVLVARGERVKKGTLLIELAEPELVLRRDELADDLKLAQMREVQYRRQGKIALSAAQTEQAESLQRQWRELDAEVASLKIHATRDGLVVGGAIESLKGRFVEEGDELLSVCDPQEKELLVSIITADVEAYQQAASKAVPTMVRLRGGNSFHAMPQPLRPRARRSLPHPALGANVGGPIAVEPSPDGKNEMRSASPLMEGVTPLDPLISNGIQAGQIGTMTISDNRSLVTRIMAAMQ